MTQPIWHSSDIYYGYEICLPSDMNSKEFNQHLQTLYSLNTHLPESFKVYGVLNRFCNDVEYYSEFDQLTMVIIGIKLSPSELSDTDKLRDECNKLKAYMIQENNVPEVDKVLDEYEIMEDAKFYCGIEWRGSEYYEELEDDDDDSEESDDEYSHWSDYDDDDDDDDTDEVTDEDDSTEITEDEDDEDEDEEDEEKE
jgi:hypothetical protein